MGQSSTGWPFHVHSIAAQFLQKARKRVLKTQNVQILSFTWTLRWKWSLKCVFPRSVWTQRQCSSFSWRLSRRCAADPKAFNGRSVQEMMSFLTFDLKAGFENMVFSCGRFPQVSFGDSVASLCLWSPSGFSIWASVILVLTSLWFWRETKCFKLNLNAYKL